MSDELGDRQKGYEQAEAGRRLMPLLPVLIRLDGKNFSSLTKSLIRTKDEPYNKSFHDMMVVTAKVLAEETNARIAYTQSDEITLVLKSDKYTSQVYFDGKTQKLVSVLAARASIEFNVRCSEYQPFRTLAQSHNPVFDCRVWNVPNETEAANAVLWRVQDAAKNSISMSARTMFSHKELDGKTGRQMQEMMFQQHAVNWDKYPAFFKRGTFLLRKSYNRKLTEQELEMLPEKHEARCNPDLIVERSDYIAVEMPIFTTVTNREDVIFRGAIPKTS